MARPTPRPFCRRNPDRSCLVPWSMPTSPPLRAPSDMKHADAIRARANFTDGQYRSPFNWLCTHMSHVVRSLRNVLVYLAILDDGDPTRSREHSIFGFRGRKRNCERSRTRRVFLGEC